MIQWDDTALHKIVTDRLNEAGRKVRDAAAKAAAGRYAVTFTEGTGDAPPMVGTDAAGLEAEYGRPAGRDEPAVPAQNWLMGAVREAKA